VVRQERDEGLLGEGGEINTVRQAGRARLLELLVLAQGPRTSFHPHWRFPNGPTQGR
jgi:hypothetical protein